MNTTPSSAPQQTARAGSIGVPSRGDGSDQTQTQDDHATHQARVGERALVLGGGGSTGNAWLIGVVAGLLEAGVDITDADLVVGTSAGSTAAAQLAGATPAELLAATLTGPPQQPQRATRERGHAPGKPVVDHMARISAIIADSAGPAEMRRRMGAAALALDAASAGSFSAQWRATVAARLPTTGWPQRTLLITAVDAESGDPVVFDRRSGVELADAVAASCASGLPYRIGGHRYIDGGFRTNADNADLAAGYARALVLSPLSGKSLTPAEWGTHLSTQIEALRTGGSRVETVVPDARSEHLFGANAMNPSLRPSAARAGHDHGTALASRLMGFWH